MVVRRIGSGPPVVWIHGLGEWSISFEPLVRAPELAGFTHVLPDLPGYGRSPWVEVTTERDSLEELAERLAAWLAEQPPAIAIGHSMGGVLGTLLAQRRAIRGLANIEGNLSRGDCTFSGQAAAFSFEEFADHWFAEMKASVYREGQASSALRGYYAALCLANPAAFHRHASDLVTVSEREHQAGSLAALAIPVLYIAGVPNGICERSRALLSQHGVRWIGVEPAGHWVYVDQHATCVEAIAGFLREVVGALPR